MIKPGYNGTKVVKMFALQYIIDAGAMAATMGAGAAAVSNKYPSYPILSFISYFIPVQYWSGPARRRRLGGP